MQQAEKAGRVEAAAVSQTGAYQVLVVGCDGLQYVQHGHWILWHVVSAALE